MVLSLHTSTIEEVREMVKTPDYYIFLAASSKASKIIQGFLSLRSIYPDIKFEIIHPLAFNEFLGGKNVPELPGLIFVNDSKVVTSVGPIDTESTLAFQIDLYLTKHRRTATTQEELVAALGHAPYTVICPFYSFNHAFNIAQTCGNKIAPCDVVNLANSLATAIGLAGQTLAIFRKADQVLEPIEGNYKAFEAAATPVFDTASKVALKRSKTISVGWCVDRPYPAHQNFLFELGSNFKSYSFFFIPSELRKHLEKGTGQKFRPNEFIAFNYHEKYLIDNKDFFNDQVIQQFHPQAWTQIASQYLIAINKLKKHYVSEQSSFPYKPGTLNKVIGRTFKQFIQNTQEDTLILFLSRGCNKCNDLFKSFRQFIDECEGKNITTLKFGFIDVRKNSIEGSFNLTTELPFMYLYPANSTQTYPLIDGLERDDIARLVNFYGTNKYEFESKLPSAEEYEAVAKNWQNHMKKMKPKDKEIVAAHLKKVQQLLNTNKEL